MAFDSRVYRVLIASPMDVTEERDAAVEVMQEWNAAHSNTRRVVVLPVRWESDSVPEYGVRPQEAINRQLADDCDLVVGIFWTKFGTPTGKADSGTLEEIERVAAAGKQVMLYFSHVPVDPDSIESTQLEKVRAFRKRIQKLALVETFGRSLDFRKKFATQLDKKIQTLVDSEKAGKPLPLDLQFASCDSGELIGKTLSLEADWPDVSQTDGEIAADVKKGIEDELGYERVRNSIPLVMAVKNMGASGIRNLFVEMSIRPSADVVLWRSSAASGSNFYYTNSFPIPAFQNEREREIDANLSGQGLMRERQEWKYSFEWDAIQPQRIRYIKPYTFLNAPEPATIKFSAKIYADNFATPITLEVDAVLTVKRQLLDSSTLAARARERNRLTFTSTNSIIRGLT